MFFLISSSRLAPTRLRFAVLHDASGTPRVHNFVVDMVDESGDAFTRAETVTMFNEFRIMAPEALLDDRFVWHAVSDTSAAVTFTNGARRVSATLFFHANDDLVDFSCNDQRSLPNDGERWTTPLRGHQEVTGLRLPTEGDSVWHYADKPARLYGRFVIQRSRYNVAVGELPRAERIGAFPDSAP